MKPIMNGQVYTHELDDWEISWESRAEYRHWCYQKHPKNNKTLLVVMFNPGSLSGDGKNLKKDTTLRILRDVCGNAGFNTLVINLFDYAEPNSQGIINNWDKRDSDNLVFEYVNNYFKYDYYIMAYGNFENNLHSKDIKERISYVRSYLGSNEIILPANQTGTPKHPMVWQRQNIKKEITDILRMNK